MPKPESFPIEQIFVPTKQKKALKPETVAEIAMPAMRGSFFKLDRSPDVINWDPI